VNRHERIVLLLDNYVDVLHGLRDRIGSGEHLPLMCRAFNKPRLGYPELERLRLQLRVEQPRLYWHLAETYFRPERRRILQCPRCRGVMPTWHSAHFHKHGHQNVAVVPRVLKVIHPGVNSERVEEAIAWLDEHWLEPGPFVPDELKAMAA
jgi:hypothetical protein